MRKSNELQIGKAGEYLACADLITKGLIAFPSEQGLPYDVVIDTGTRLLRCQVKTTGGARVVPQRNKPIRAYIFNIKRHGKNGAARYTPEEVDVFALVELDTRTVGYLVTTDMPATINLRVDGLRGSHYDEKGGRDYIGVMEEKAAGLNQSETSRKLGVSLGTVHRMFQDGYEPHVSSARYFSDLYRDAEWFNGI